MHSVDSSCFRHVLLLRDVPDSVARKKPRQEIHCGDGHADAEEHAGKYTLRAAFTEGEGEAGHDNGNERKTASDGAGESLLQHANCVFPWGSSLSEGWSREEKCETEGDER
jgi:hypothetical protein